MYHSQEYNIASCGFAVASNSQSYRPRDQCGYCSIMLGKYIKNQKPPALNKGRSYPVITMSGKRGGIIGHPKTILVVQCDWQGTLMFNIFMFVYSERKASL